MKRARSPDEKPRLSTLVSAVGAGMVSLGVLLYYLTIGKNKLVIRLHYAGWQTHVKVLIGIFLLSLGFTTWKVWKLLKWRRANGLTKPKPEARPKQPSWNELETPEGLYEYVQVLRRQADDHDSEELETITAQFDEMNDLQDKLEILLRLNRCQDSLKEARDLLQEIEDAICLNVKKLINYVTVGADDLKTNLSPQTITENRKLLNEARDILRDLAEFINNGKGDIGRITQRIKDYRGVIHEMLEEERDEKHDEENPGSGDDYFPTLNVNRM